MSTILAVEVPLALTETLCSDALDEVVAMPAPTGDNLDTQAADVLLIGSDVDEPLRLAQLAHAADPNLGVLVLGERERLGALRRELMFTPFVGEHVAFAAQDDGESLCLAVREAVYATGARRSHAAERRATAGWLQAGPDWRISAEELVEPLLQAAPIGVILLDEDGKVREWNRYAETVLGHDKSAALGRPLPELLGDARDDATCLLGGAEVLQPLCCRAEPELWVRLTASRLARPNGTRTLVLLQDVTELVAAEAARERALEQVAIAQRFESLGTLAGGIAHDFNNLLAVILGSADLARLDTGNEASVNESLDNIITAAQRASELTATMLSFAGRDAAMPEPLDLADLAGESVRLLRASTRRHIVIEFDADDTPLVVRADRRQLQQVVMNLIRNAVDAIGDKSGTVHVHANVSAGEDGDRARLEVRDDGAGMSEETMARMYEPFFTTKRTGRGLGLAAVLGNVRNNGGHIDCDSKPGRGTVFRITFPLYAGSAPRTLENDSADEPTMPSANILIVEDEPGVAHVGRRILARGGHEVDTAEDGVVALERIEERVPDLVLLDMCMPRMNGRQTLLKLRERYPDLPVVLCSGYVETEVEDLLDLGPTTFLKKPYKAEALRAIVNDALRNR
ncbi:MAG: response regulator [Woeseiaceae bacterium]|nr:response regulator [Woeseiaceae bacterium]